MCVLTTWNYIGSRSSTITASQFVIAIAIWRCSPEGVWDLADKNSHTQRQIPIRTLMSPKFRPKRSLAFPPKARAANLARLCKKP